MEPNWRYFPTIKRGETTGRGYCPSAHQEIAKNLHFNTFFWDVAQGGAAAAAAGRHAPDSALPLERARDDDDDGDEDEEGEGEADDEGEVGGGGAAAARRRWNLGGGRRGDDLGAVEHDRVEPRRLAHSAGAVLGGEVPPAAGAVSAAVLGRGAVALPPPEVEAVRAAGGPRSPARPRAVHRGADGVAGLLLYGGALAAGAAVERGGGVALPGALPGAAAAVGVAVGPL